MLKCGITGATGVLGRQIIKKLPYKFIIFKNNIENFKKVQKWVNSNKLDIVLHLAAVVPTNKVNKNFNKAKSVNIFGTKKDDGTYEYYIYEITCKAMLDSTQINPSYVTGNLDFVVGQGTNSDRTTFGSPREFQGIHVPWHYSGENVGTHTDSEGRTWVEQKINFSGNDNQAGDAFTNPSGAGSFFTFAEGFVYISLGWQTTQINQVAYVDDVKIKRVEKVEVLEKNINSSYNIKSISGLNDGKIKLDFSKPMKNEHYVVAGTVESGILNVTEKNKNYVKFSIVDDIASTGELKFQEGALKDFKNCNITIH